MHLPKELTYTAYVTAEECNEVSQSILKLLRFGLNQEHPVSKVTNKTALEEELGQLMYCIDRLRYELDLDYNIIMDAYHNKSDTWNKWKAYYDC